MKKIFILGILLPLIGLSGCSSKSADDDLSVILTQGPWTTTINSEDLDLDGNYVEFGDDCEKDDTWYFSTNGTFEQKNGPLSCDGTSLPSDIIVAGNWLFEDNETYLVLQFPLEEIKMKILNYSSTQLEMGLVEDNNPSGVFTQKVILQR